MADSEGLGEWRPCECVTVGRRDREHGEGRELSKSGEEKHGGITPLFKLDLLRNKILTNHTFTSYVRSTSLSGIST